MRRSFRQGATTGAESRARLPRVDHRSQRDGSAVQYRTASPVPLPTREIAHRVPTLRERRRKVLTMESQLQDLKFGMRLLWKNKGFTTTTPERGGIHLRPRAGSRSGRGSCPGRSDPVDESEPGLSGGGAGWHQRAKCAARHRPGGPALRRQAAQQTPRQVVGTPRVLAHFNPRALAASQGENRVVTSTTGQTFPPLKVYASEQLAPGVTLDESTEPELEDQREDEPEQTEQQPLRGSHAGVPGRCNEGHQEDTA